MMGCYVNALFLWQGGVSNEKIVASLLAISRKKPPAIICQKGPNDSPKVLVGLDSNGMESDRYLMPSDLMDLKIGPDSLIAASFAWGDSTIRICDKTGLVFEGQVGYSARLHWVGQTLLVFSDSRRVDVVRINQKSHKWRSISYPSPDRTALLATFSHSSRAKCWWPESNIKFELNSYVDHQPFWMSRGELAVVFSATAIYGSGVMFYRGGFNICDSKLRQVKPIKIDFLETMAVAPLSNTEILTLDSLEDFRTIGQMFSGGHIYAHVYNVETGKARPLWDRNNYPAFTLMNPY